MDNFPVYADEDFNEHAQYNVLRGAAWLDENAPGWHDKINPETLTMMDTNRCVLGQGIGPNAYSELMDEHGVAWVLENGFCMSSLRAMWVELIEARQLVSA